MRCPALVSIAASLALVAAPALAQDKAPAPRPACTDFRILSRGCRTVEVYGGSFVEAWNFNGRPKVTLPGEAVIVSATWRDGWGLALEWLGTSVQQRGPNTFVGGGSALLRRRLLGRRAVVVFAEGGVGASYSTAIVPARGTRFNYLAQGGVAVAAHLAPHVGAIASFRVFHLSNASLNGPSHNPDIEALGGRVGVFVVF